MVNEAPWRLGRRAPLACLELQFASRGAEGMIRPEDFECFVVRVNDFQSAGNNHFERIEARNSEADISGKLPGLAQISGRN